MSTLDVFTKRKRSEVMSRIRGRGNKDTELALAKLLRKHGITGWRRNQAVFGKPDFVFPHQRLAVFVDGCFWHGCPIHSKPARWLKNSSMPDAPPSSRRARVESSPQRFNTNKLALRTLCETSGSRGQDFPRTGRAFWKRKLTANIARDRLVNRQLRLQRWTVLRIWEHDLTNHPSRCLHRINAAIQNFPK